MNKTQKAHQISLANWALRFKEQADSGLTVKAWCLQNNISIHTYNYWKHLVKQEYLESVLPAVPEIVPIITDGNLLTSSGLTPTVPVVHHHSPCSGESPVSLNSNSISIELSGIRISADPSISDEFLLRILKAVRHA